MRLLNPTILLFRILKEQQTGYRCLSIASNSNVKDSYYFKKSDLPLINSTVGKTLDKIADEHGDHTIYISHPQGISKTYSELRNEVEKLATGLISCGLRRGDRVAIYSPNCYEWPLAQFALAKAGLVAVTINFASQPVEVEHCLRKTGCRSVITFDKTKHYDFYNVFNKIIPNLKTSNPMKLQSDKLPNLEKIFMISEDEKEGTILMKDVMNMGNRDSSEILSKFEKEVQINDPVNIQFTSGTTSSPKAAVISHYSALNVSNHFSIRIGLHLKPSTFCCQLPLFHVFGGVFCTFVPIIRKSTVVFPGFTFDATESLQSIEKYKCSTVLGTPTMFIDLLKMHETLKSDMSSVDQTVLGGSPVPEGILKSLYDKSIANIQRGYGLTESTAGCAANNLNTDYDTLISGYMEPLEGTEIKIINSGGKLQPKNTPGEICIKGYQSFSGYFDDEKKTAEVVDENGFFHTGDLGEMNEKGWIKIVGRIKDMVIRGGENIYVTEIENFLSNHPSISEVQICGVPDERLGEELCCWINVKPGMTLTAEDVKQFCEGKLSYYKIPRYILFVEEFPKNTVGKVKKHEMIEISKAKLNL